MVAHVFSDIEHGRIQGSAIACCKNSSILFILFFFPLLIIKLYNTMLSLLMGQKCIDVVLNT